MGFSYAMFCLSLPLICILAVVVSPSWRFRLVSFVELLSRLLTFGSLMHCLWPSKVDALLHARLEDGEFGHGVSPHDDDDHDEYGGEITDTSRCLPGGTNDVELEEAGAMICE